jgi:cytochrome d ubiquinol oxidase subunit II
MLDFSTWLDLPLIWGGLIATAVLLYVLLDGFDLGVGILFPFAPSDKCRSRMMNSVAPFWDGNETWLVLGGGGLLAAFPLAFAVIMPALYLPIIFMLLGLIFRGVAFEFRFKAEGWHRQLWDYSFFGGSVIATFMQGIVLGNFVQGFTVEGRAFAGGALDWINQLALATGVALIGGYGLLGATWIHMKTEDKTQDWARKLVPLFLLWTGAAMVMISVAMPLMFERIYSLWFSMPNLLYFSVVPLLTALCFLMVFLDIRKGREVRPFIFSNAIFLFGFIGLGISLWPWVVPYEVTLSEGAAASTSLSLLLIGTVILLPVILTYTAWSYYVFRGKSSHEALY